jgi:large subunit ribosomal protein L18
MNKETRIKLKNRAIRKNRTRTKIANKSDLPRFSVFRSLKHFSIQIIDDKTGRTVCSATDKEVKGEKLKRIDIAAKVGEIIAKKATEKKITQVVLDRGEYKFHGSVKSAVEAAKNNGLKI